ncbi:SDR family oxidoreductase [Bacillus horti]|uniref:NAD(P)-dependent dehydrogenase (Short-subunit alcohol dehydrogenase family) n=1 Tax=Caldalkalibacillus horti TaxID=77523 RepID=A0ABT9VWP0_9BACI|nr:SDR family oxidoreductase [Bacillus horti]MDQ0165403.1 NAD(P)-dependent dehydrogenase (short-subunit alcohol dehydrogenase family) [Bacillus horti]
MGQNDIFNQIPKQVPAQQQEVQPGIEAQMNPRPLYDNPSYKGSGKLKDRVVLITGGDSGIGRAVSVAFAKEGAKLAILYLNEEQDAQETKKIVEEKGGQCHLIAGDIGSEAFCQQVVEQVVQTFGKLDILINNAAMQVPQKDIRNISADQLELTFRTNLYSYFYLTKAALPYLSKGSSIVNTTSVTAYKGHDQLVDYSSTKGAIVSFTRSLSEQIAGQGIRVNGIAPGPIWTPLIPATFEASKVAQFGQDTPMKRPGQPFELAPAYVYLASDDSSYMSGQVLHINGGTIVNG